MGQILPGEQPHDGEERQQEILAESQGIQQMAEPDIGAVAGRPPAQQQDSALVRQNQRKRKKQARERRAGELPVGLSRDVAWLRHGGRRVAGQQIGKRIAQRQSIEQRGLGKRLVKTPSCIAGERCVGVRDTVVAGRKVDHEVMHQAWTDGVNADDCEVSRLRKHIMPEQFRQCLHSWQHFFASNGTYLRRFRMDVRAHVTCVACRP